ncbi:MAG: hypothetical protein NWQ54_25320 [Paraglaciecola sp.]|nr:hypothetical protein [Paraglaciecola sp.]
MKNLFHFILALAVSACTYNNNVLEIYAQKNSATEFRGILDVIKSSDKNVNILFVHGMRGYSYTNGVSDPCRVATDIRDGLNTTPLEVESSEKGELFCQGFLNYKDKKILIMPNYWGALTNLPKYDLAEYDNDPKITEYRTKITSLVKDNLINDGFADAVMYTGNLRQAIIDNVSNSILLMQSKNPNSTTIIVTFSLGSKIVLDTIKQLQDKNSLGDLKNNVEMVYLMANQIPLLNTGFMENGVDQNSDTRREQLIKEYENFNLILKTDPPKVDSKNKIKVVAFTDPNDLLSYTLAPETMGSLKDNYVNVAISIATKTTYVPLKREYGIVNYLTAHTGYVHNNKVRNLLMNGTVEGRD